jgi:hypothetical protein
MKTKTNVKAGETCPEIKGCTVVKKEYYPGTSLTCEYTCK